MKIKIQSYTLKESYDKCSRELSIDDISMFTVFNLILILRKVLRFYVQ